MKSEPAPILYGRAPPLKVVAINDKVIAKFGSSINTWEGQTLIYLEQYAPEVLAPQLYAMYHNSNQVFLIMQRIPGAQLDIIWPSLTESEKDNITTKLRQIFDTMRKVKCPWPDFYGSLDGGSVHHYLFYSQHGDQKYLGPFNGEAAFVTGLVGNYRALVERNGRPGFKARFYETYLSKVLQNHQPTLTHGDVQKKNIIVAGKMSDHGERSFDVRLVDWENAGWYPGFWEYFCATSPYNFSYWEDDWCWRIHEFLQVYAAEMSLLQMIDKDYLV